MKTEDKLKLFGMSTSLAERELDQIEDRFKVDFQRNSKDEKDEDYYPQFDSPLRAEASQMSKHYELFYCLEKSIRKLIAENLKAQHGESWFDKCVPQPIKENVKFNIQREIDAGFTLRSEQEIDFTTFGELGEIVKLNWNDFGAIFSSDKAFTKIMTNLNVLRSPIAHCCPLSQDEIVRLNLTVKDWFRLME